MTDTRRMLLGLSWWAAVISALHLRLNVDWAAALNEYLPEEKRKLNVAYIPVT